MHRRDLLDITRAPRSRSAACRALAQRARRPAFATRGVRVYTTSDGGSRVEELAISPDAKPIPAPGG